MSEEESEYEVGYGRPPKQHQFIKGRSGNPNGRPKKIKNQQELLWELLEGEIQVNGKPVTKQRAFFVSLINQAIKGHPSAQKMLLQLMSNKEEELEDFSPTLDDRIAWMKINQKYEQRKDGA